MTELREFNEAGIDAFRAYLTRTKDEPNLELPCDLLQAFRYTKAVPGGVRIQSRGFGSKLEFGRYIAAAVNGHVPDQVLRRSLGLWSWLALFYFDELCPAGGNGQRRVLRLEKYIPSAQHIATGLDKHLLFFPWKMTTLHGDEAAWLLGGPLGEDTKVVRELANSYRRNVSLPFIKLAKSLYFDAQNGCVRKGATTTTRPGSLRRLDRVVDQLDLTYDVFGIEAECLATLLPRREFSRWLPASGSS